ncbi:MAG TPA: hypothetical protein VF173_26485 [Thermoanaerobaculia bacterium]|nr:hypothetical protein [Thermoanaerobaculia bacterium]
MSKLGFNSTTGGWEKLLTTVEANKADLEFLDPLRLQLTAALEGAKAANVRQSTSQAQVQQATRDLEKFMATGRDLATRLRNGIRTQYGLKGEKLTEFGLQPLRKPKKAVKPAETPTPATPVPAAK